MKKVLKTILAILTIFFFIAYPVSAANTHSATLVAASSQYFTATDSVSLSLTENNTLEFWIKLTSQPASDAYMFLINKDDIASQRSYGLTYYDAAGTQKIALYLFQTLTATIYSVVAFTYTLPIGTWTHLAIVTTIANPVATKCELFINGISQGNGVGTDVGGGATSIADGTAILQLGARAAGEYLDAQIDDVRIWNIVRTAAQIDANKAVEIDSATNLQASWHLNNVLTDSSGNANTLTAVNSPTFSTDVPFVGAVPPSQESDLIIFE